MTFVAEFFLAAISALVIENAILGRSLGSSWMLYLIRHPKELLSFTGIMAVMITSAGLVAYPLRASVMEGGYSYVSLPILYLFCMAFVYGLAYLILSRFMPKLFRKISARLADATFNCCVLGAVLIPATESMDLAKTIGYGLGMTLGFAGAVVLIGLGVQRIELCHVPKAFKGLPILLIYIGLLSLAIYGLIGHQLPT